VLGRDPRAALAGDRDVVDRVAKRGVAALMAREVEPRQPARVELGDDEPVGDRERRGRARQPPICISWS